MLQKKVQALEQRVAFLMSKGKELLKKAKEREATANSEHTAALAAAEKAAEEKILQHQKSQFRDNDEVKNAVPLRRAL